MKNKWNLITICVAISKYLVRCLYSIVYQFPYHSFRLDLGLVSI